MSGSRRIEVTGAGTLIYVSPQHECSQRIVPEEIEITITGAVAAKATTLSVAATANTETILAPIWLDLKGPDGSELTVCVTDDIAPGATSLTIKKARIKIPANATAEYPPQIIGALTSNIEPSQELDTTTPLDQGGNEVSAYTTSGASVSCEFPYFGAAGEMTVKHAAKNKELVFLKFILPNPTCPDDESYDGRPIRAGFFLIDGGVPTPLEAGTPIRHSVNFKKDGAWQEYSDGENLTP